MVKAELWRDWSPEKGGFFDVLTMKDMTGKQIKVFRGFIGAGGAMIQKLRKDIYESARLGKDFGKKR